MRENLNERALNELICNVEKPSKPHVMDSQMELTEQELKSRKFLEEQLSELGISTSVFDATGEGYEDPDVLEAIILVNKGIEIPIDLKIKIKNKKLQELEKEEQSKECV